jgi:aryl-alcohol dehydrogenase-like predicted oxidoreductase
LLSGKFTREAIDETARRAKFDFPPVDKERGFAILDVMRTAAAHHGASVAQVALAWLLARDIVTSVIIGVRNLTQLEDNLQAVDRTLSPDELRALDEVSLLAPEYPAWMDVLPSDRRPGEERRW